MGIGMKNIFKVGSKIDIVYREPGREPEEYYSKIIDSNEHYLIIDYPVNRKTKKTAFFSIGASFVGSLTAEDKAVYQFPVKVAARVKVNFPAIAIWKPEKDRIERIQRRQFVRLDTSLDISLNIKGHPEDRFTSITSDISGGGLSFILPGQRELDAGEIIELWLVLGFQSGKIHYVHTTAEIVFVQEKNGIRSASVKFLTLKPKEQQLIISFCFEKQREMRKKELS